MSHQSSHIIIKTGGGGSLTSGEDPQASVEFTLPPGMDNKTKAKLIVKHLNWLDTLSHADAADT